MYRPPHQAASLPVRIQRWLTWLLHAAAIYLIPLGIGLVSLLALLFWHDQYEFRDNLPLDVRVLAEDAASATPAAALARLQSQRALAGFHTHLGAAPFWFSFDTVHRVGGTEMIEFPSRHAVAISCWDTNGMTLLGSSIRDGARAAPAQAMFPAKAGFALRLPFLPVQLLCRASFAGPGYLSVAQWPAEQFYVSIDRFHRKSGLLDGGMIVLALLVLLLAILQRQVLYVVFAGWLILNLRIGALAAGWDTQWLGQMVPAPWLMGGRALVVVLYGISTLTLYQMLLGAYLVDLRQRLPLRVVQWMILPTLFAALILPYNLFVPVLWLTSVISVGLLTFDLARILLRARSRVALYFAAALAVAFVSGLTEIVAGTLDLPQFDGAIDSVSAALASSLLAALAVAEHTRVATARRLLDQSDLGRTWESNPAALFTLDMEGRFLNGNPALWTMLGEPPRDTAGPGSSWQQVFGEPSWLRLQALLHAQRQVELDVEQRGDDAGSTRRLVVRATLAQARIEGVLSNVSEERRTIEQLRSMVHHDCLTGVLNRRGIAQTFEAALGALGAGRPLVLAFLRLDRFRLVSDLYGHAAGDEVLKQVCERVTALLSGGEQIGRLGGDAFLIIMPDTGIGAATVACRSLVERIGSAPYLVGEKALTVHASLGLIAVAQGMSLDDAIVSADRACRAAGTDAGGGLVAHAREAETKLVARLCGPKATEDLALAMQPVVMLAAPHAALNIDVQLSMPGPGGGVGAAGPVIDAADKSGRAGVIDRWIVSATLDWLTDHAAHLPPMGFVLIKMSGSSLNDEHFLQDLLTMLRRHAAVAGHLCLAISEKVALQDLAHTRRVIEQVRGFGVRLALDEFGTFPGTLAQLKALQADLVRIDSSVTSALQAQPGDSAIVEAMVQLARSTGMKTIVCKIRDSATVRLLTGLGIDYVQGDAVARAQTPDAMLVAPSSGSPMAAFPVPGMALADLKP